jgi:S-adenosyl-L-methionine hydrolase (adenosine-forming)
MITLTTDFGLKDPYVAEMKGVILSINPDAKLIDVSHDVEKFDIRMGAFMLASVTPYFPKGTVHLAVIDPGVGTDRRAIVVQTKDAFFVGPDNGLLMLTAKSYGILNVFEIANPAFRLPRVSSTFHGRDIFAPAAAYLDKGVKPEQFGSKVTDFVIPKFVYASRKSNTLTGEVLNIDSFGNIVTNIVEKELGKIERAIVKLSDCSLEFTFAKTYAEAKPKEPIALIGSHGFLEISLNKGSAAEKFKIHSGDAVTVTLS